MPKDQAQLAARIDARVKEAVEEYCRAKGLKMNRFIETALLDRLEEIEDIEDVVYIDPMYPEKKGSARVKKEMLALQQLLGPDTDSLSLFHNAMQTASRRVVIKRPKHANWLHDQKPDTAIESKNTRYDIYVTL